MPRNEIETPSIQFDDVEFTFIFSGYEQNLNLYGDEKEFKFLPGIGEPIDQTGILCGLRPINPEIIESLLMELKIPKDKLS